MLNWIADEPLSTCFNCAEVPKYKVDLKCCTFQPFLPNYAVGKLLQEKNATIQSILGGHDNTLVLPIGIIPSFNYQNKFRGKKDSDFGQRKDLLCSYVGEQNGQLSCNIWKYRGAVCSNFFCKPQKGEAGKEFWAQLENLQSYVEMSLAQEALTHLDFSPRQVSTLVGFLEGDTAYFDLNEHNQFSAASAKKIWNGYTDTNKFFLDCADFVDAISDWEEILGEAGQQLLDQVNLDWKNLYA